jgi:ABC-2 type transport system permease protein
MKSIWIITKREINSFFDSLMAYIMIVVFLGFSGFFTWIQGADVFFVNQASLQSFFSIAYWTLFFFIPAITMRLIAEEKKTGTIEMILTKPVSERQIVAGKFLATLLLILIALALTTPYYFTVANIGKVDHGAILFGYLGLALMSAAYISIGIFTSCLSNNQIIAFLLALCIGIFFQIIFDVFADSLPGFLGRVSHFMSMSTHFESIARGVFDSKDIIYFLSIITLGLVGSEAVLSKRD